MKKNGTQYNLQVIKFIIHDALCHTFYIIRFGIGAGNKTKTIQLVFYSFVSLLFHMRFGFVDKKKSKKN